MAFMTARYARDINVLNNSTALASDIPTFARALGQAGYEAVLCGRMHFNGADQLHGFERRLIGDCGSYLSESIMGRGLNRTNGQTRYAVEVSGYGRAGFEVFDEEVTHAATQFIAQQRKEQRPYCLVVGLMQPHNPLICERGLFEQYMDTLPPLSDEHAPPSNPAITAWRRRRGVDKLQPQHIRRARAAYYGLVTTMDRNAGIVIDAVHNSPDADDTVILYCSDHGDQAGEHGMWWKSTFFHGSIGVPLIASWPGRFVQGVALNAVVNLIDVGPTLIDLAAAPPMAEVSGRSLLPMLYDGQAPDDWLHETFAEYNGGHGDQPSAMLRSGPWKLMYYPEFETCLLYNLDDDPREMNDRADDPAAKTVRDELLAKLKTRWPAYRTMKPNAAANAVPALAVKAQSKPAPLPENANQFDFEQVPEWAAIHARMETNEL